ncbi:MAG: hypothetical protein OEN02_19925 [Gammaproteobacteria bacterium]|nr:hypothetical protein [Gammaproteobacteria bacterium]MDH3536749.1 hypothetical protein [Gammaproteobacteria bacterium]
MLKTNCCSTCKIHARQYLTFLLLAVLATPALPQSAGENLSGFYARLGNDDSPAETAGNNIYIKFFPDRWLGLLFVPYPYAHGVDAATIEKVFVAARKRTDSAAYLRDRFGLLDQAATVQVERYGYYQDRIAFECGALSACSIRLADGYLDLIKPGVINEHIIRYDHVDVDAQ